VKARGLVDQPLRHPRYEARIAEVRAACVGRVTTAHRHNNGWIAGLLIAVLPVAFAVSQLFVADRPWENRTWWPGAAFATGTPDACVGLSTEAARRLVPDGEPDHGYGDAGSAMRNCRLTGGTPRLEVDVYRATYGDLIAEAKDDVDRVKRSGGNYSPVADLGDEAFAGADNGSNLKVVARRCNVVVEVQLNPDGDVPDPGAPAYTAMLRSLVDVVRPVIDAVDLR
jgi:hypothetical protein